MVLAESLTSYLEIMPHSLDALLALNGLQKRVVVDAGIAAYLRSPNRWRRPDDQYVIDVARVLQRALPSHMSDPDRFGVK